MATTIVTKKGSGAPAASDLVEGELAVDTTNGRLYTENSSAAVVELGSNPSGNITFGDNGKAIFGAGSDLQIYHDGSNSYIDDAGTGDLLIRAENNLFLKRTNSDETYLSGAVNGAVTLFHNNNAKIATTISGIDVTGSVTADGATFSGSGTSAIVNINNGVDNTPNRQLAISETGGSGFIYQLDSTGASGLFGQLAFATNGTERLRIDSAGNVGIGTTSPTEELTVGSGGSNYIGIGGDGVNASGIRFYRGASTVDGLIEVDANEDMIISMDNTGALGTGQILFKTGATERMRLDASGNLLVGKTSDAINVAGVVNYNAGIVRASRNGNSGQFGRISTDGDIVTFYKDTVTVGSIGTGSGDLHIDGAASHSGVRFQASSLIPRLNGADADNSIDLGYDDGTDTYRFKDLYLSGNINLGTKITAASVTTTVNAWKSTSNSTSSSKHMLFANPNGNVGDIRTNGSATAYITSSDYRLKENVVAMSGATERLKQLKPSRFNFIADADTTVDGFLAHEVQAVVPEAIAGDKDGMMDEEYEVTPAVLDDDGNVVTEAVMGTRSVPDYQGIDQSKLVPLLVATIQELEARITALES
jgi:hypothetical protein